MLTNQWQMCMPLDFLTYKILHTDTTFGPSNKPNPSPHPLHCRSFILTITKHPCTSLGVGTTPMDLPRWNLTNRKVPYPNACSLGHRTFHGGRYGRSSWLPRTTCTKEKTRHRHYTNRIYGNIGWRRLMPRCPLVVEGAILRRRRRLMLRRMRRRKSVMLIKGWVRRTRWGGGVNNGMHAGGGPLPIVHPLGWGVHPLVTTTR